MLKWFFLPLLLGNSQLITNRTTSPCCYCCKDMNYFLPHLSKVVHNCRPVYKCSSLPARKTAHALLIANNMYPLDSRYIASLLQHNTAKRLLTHIWIHITDLLARNVKYRQVSNHRIARRAMILSTGWLHVWHDTRCSAHRGPPNIHLSRRS